jgi:hypothetical protein
MERQPSGSARSRRLLRPARPTVDRAAGVLVTVVVDADAHGPPPADITAGLPCTGVESADRVRVVLWSRKPSASTDPPHRRFADRAEVSSGRVKPRGRPPPRGRRLRLRDEDAFLPHALLALGRTCAVVRGYASAQLRRRSARGRTPSDDAEWNLMVVGLRGGEQPGNDFGDRSAVGPRMRAAWSWRISGRTSSVSSSSSNPRVTGPGNNVQTPLGGAGCVARGRARELTPARPLATGTSPGGPGRAAAPRPASDGGSTGAAAALEYFLLPWPRVPVRRRCRRQLSFNP